MPTTFEEIKRIIEDEGTDVPEKTRNRLLLIAMVELNHSMDELKKSLQESTRSDKEAHSEIIKALEVHDKRIEHLERNSLLLLVQRHPKTFFIIVTAITVALIVIRDLKAVILPLFGVNILP